MSVVAATAVPFLQTCPGTAGRHHCSGALGLAPSQSGPRAALAAHTTPAAAPVLRHVLLVQSVNQSASQYSQPVNEPVSQ